MKRKQFTTALEHLEPRTMLTGAPELVRDINIQIEEPEIGHLMEVRDSSFFLKDHELWRTNGSSDGSSEGTRFIRDVSPSPIPESQDALDTLIPRISEYQVVGDQLYFVTEHRRFIEYSFDNAMEHYDELWVTDGTHEGTVLLKSGPGEIRDLVQIEDRLFFTNTNQAWVLSGFEGIYQGRTAIWRTDGSHQGTLEVVPQSEDVRAIVQYNGQLVYATEKLVGSLDQHEASTTFLNVQFADSLTVNSDQLYITTSGSRDANQSAKIFKSDGTDLGTSEIHAMEGDSTRVTGQEAIGDQMFFEIRNCTSNCRTQILVSNGTEEGTLIVANNVTHSSLMGSGERILYATNTTLNMGSVSDGEVDTVVLASRQPRDATIAFAELDTHVFFVANDRESGTELHIADSASGESSLFLDLVEGPESSQPRDLIVHDGKLFFVTTSADKSQLWESDGTVVNTRVRAELDSIVEFGFAGNSLLIAGDRGNDGRRLWTSVGTELTAITDRSAKTHGSVDLKRCIYSQCSPTLSFVGVYQDFAYFYANDGERTSLWKSDGTEQGTAIESDHELRHRHHYAVGNPQQSMRLGTRLFYMQEIAGSDRTVVWASDLASAENTRLMEFNGSAQMLGSVNDQIIFSTFESTGGRIWKSDGTVDGTVAIGIADVTSSTPVATFQEELYFAARDEEHGKELWKTDGTADGTNIVADLLPGPGSAAPTELMVLNNQLLFAADDGTHGHELWSIRTDEDSPLPIIPPVAPDIANIPVGTYQPLTDFDGRFDFDRHVFWEQGELYFTVEANDETQIWNTDGSPAGTGPVLTLPSGDLRLGGYSNGATSLATNTHEFYIGNPSYELWANDGESVYQVVDLAESQNYISNLIIATTSHAFFATRGSQGDQLWSTDGTGEGTQLIAETFVSGELAVLLNDLVYFTLADYDANSTELWVSDGSATGTFVIDELTGAAWNLSAVNGTLVVDRVSETGHEPWVYRPATLGDLDRDDDVDFADFLTLSVHFGADQASREQGDINGDGKIDFADFLLMAEYFGSDQSGHEAIDAVLDDLV